MAKENDTISSAVILATSSHKNSKMPDKEHDIIRSLRIGLMGCTDEEKAAGFLYDIFNIPGITRNTLENAGIPAGIIHAAEILKDDGTSIEDQASRILFSTDPIAIRVFYNILLDRFHAGDQSIVPAMEKTKAYLENCSAISLYLQDKDTAYAIFAGGCFWGVQHEMEKIKGVTRTLVGYTGGEERFPSYEDVRSHKTGHVEAVLIEYDERITSYKDLLMTFFEIHDPSQENGQGPDIGPQYLSRIFTSSIKQRQEAMEIISILQSKGYVVNTKIIEEGPFWIGEEYHQHYYNRTHGEPYCHMRVKKF